MRIIGFVAEALAVRPILACLDEAASLTYIAPDRHPPLWQMTESRQAEAGDSCCFSRGVLTMKSPIDHGGRRSKNPRSSGRAIGIAFLPEPPSYRRAARSM